MEFKDLYTDWIKFQSIEYFNNEFIMGFLNC
jgi:hypothetical protein